MGILQVRRQRSLLRGWIKWIPVLAIPFAVLFVHAWLNIQILRADYVLRELDKEANALQEKLEHADVAQSVQQSPELLSAQADKMAFVQPEPGQLEVIVYDRNEFTPLPEEMNMELARRDESIESSAAAVTTGAPRVDDGPVLPATPMTEMTPIPLANTTAESVSVVTPPVAAPPTMPNPQAQPTPEAHPAVWMALDEVADDAFAVPVKKTVTLDLPVDTYVEEVPAVEAGMGGLEAL